MADIIDQAENIQNKFISHTGQSWIINEREGIPNLVVVEGDISNLLDEEPLIFRDRIDIESLWPSGLKTFLFGSGDTEMALAFIGENANSFVPMHWNKYTPEFVLDLLKTEDKWWRMVDYKGYAIDRSKQLLESCIEPSLSVENCFVEWAEERGVDYLGLVLNMDRGDYKFVITSNKKDELLESLRKDFRED